MSKSSLPSIWGCYILGTLLVLIQVLGYVAPWGAPAANTLSRASQLPFGVWSPSTVATLADALVTTILAHFGIAILGLCLIALGRRLDHKRHVTPAAVAKVE